MPQKYNGRPVTIAHTIITKLIKACAGTFSFLDEYVPGAIPFSVPGSPGLTTIAQDIVGGINEASTSGMLGWWQQWSSPGVFSTPSIVFVPIAGITPIVTLPKGFRYVMWWKTSLLTSLVGLPTPEIRVYDATNVVALDKSAEGAALTSQSTTHSGVQYMDLTLAPVDVNIDFQIRRLGGAGSVSARYNEFFTVRL